MRTQFEPKDKVILRPIRGGAEDRPGPGGHAIPPEGSV